MGNIKRKVGEAMIGVAGVAGFIGGLGQAPTANTGQLADSHDSQVRQRETSNGEYRGLNQADSGRSK